MTISQIAKDAADRLDGDTVTVWLSEYDPCDGRGIRVKLEPTDIPADEQINDCDVYGQVAPVEHARYRTGPGRGELSRPEGFDGAARKLHGRTWDYWWQPHPTTVAQGPDAIRQAAGEVTDLLEYGFTYLGLEILEGEDAYGRPIVQAFTGLGGCDYTIYAPDRAYLATVIADCLSDLLDNSGGL